MNKDFTFQVSDEEAQVSSRHDVTATPSPWEFSGYSHTAAEEHLQRKTASVDYKISQFRLKKLDGNRNNDASHDDDDGSDASEAHAASDKQTEEEEDDDQEDEGEEGPEEEVVEENLDDVDDANFSDKGTGQEEQKHGKRVKKNAAPDERTASRASSSFFSSSEGATFISKTFMELNISRPLIRACDALGYKQPTPIQAACIPLALTGRDICGSAVTGSGKTAAFGLPLLERLLFRPRRIPAIRVLVLTPTRELAVQVHRMIEKLAQFTDVRCCLVVGGLSSKVQEVGLRSNPDIVIATPGRMIDHLHNTHSVGLEDLAILVLDEADRLLQLGFSNEVHELVRLCPKKRQTMLFSATMTEEVNELVKLSLVNPVRLSADPLTQRPATLLEQVVKISGQHEGDKEAVLLALCSRSFVSKVIIFSGTKIEAHRLKILFGLSGLKAAELHGNLTQVQRLDALEMFRKAEVDFLIATDVAARGIDITGVATVINFECPRDITTYVHRVGRTARAGQEGCALTFACKQDRPLIKLVAKRAGSKLNNRVVPEGLIMKWHEKIQEMEKSVRGILQEERVERALRKAEMEANKVQNMMDHETEIFSRPKKIWFQTPKERKHIATAAKNAKSGTENDITNERLSSIENVGNGNSRKRPLELKKNLTRKTRRRLEAAQEVAEEHFDEDPKGQGKSGKSSARRTLAELAYRKAKAAKALGKVRETGKARSIKGVGRNKPPHEKNRREEMQELFQSDISSSKGRNQSKGVSRSSKRKPGISKRSFKSKTRYKRR